MAKIELFGRLGSGSAVCEALLALVSMPYTMTIMNKREDGTYPPELFAVNPLGQVPALLTVDGTLMTESGAIALWIADLAAQSKLAPAASDPTRAKYLRVMFFMAANCYMTALRFYYPDRYSTDEDHADSIRAKARTHMDREFAILTEMLGADNFLLGDTMSAADVYLSMLISWEEDGAHFALQYPALAQLNTRVWKNKTVADVWLRNGYVE
jgi:glutathione S-transferase